MFDDAVVIWVRGESSEGKRENWLAINTLTGSASSSSPTLNCSDRLKVRWLNPVDSEDKNKQIQSFIVCVERLSC